MQELLKKLFPKMNASNEGLPFMGFKEENLFGVPARVFRISFSGELAYEVNVESDYGIFMWKKIIELGSGKVLTGIAKRMVKDVTAINIEVSTDFDQF